ncbi:MAG TPA: CopD family protein [Alphaproteobacteria bacterium]|jgi:copper transport protein
MKRFFFALFLLSAAVLPAGSASAHAVLLETQPADRAVVADSPSALLLRFNETVQPIAVSIVDEAGLRVAAAAKVSAVDHDLRIELAAPLSDGAYVVSYRITSEDSHPVSGAFLFAVGAVPTAWAEPASAAESDVWPLANGLNRALHLAGLLLLAGGLLFLLVMPGEGAANRRPLVPVLTACGALAAVTALLTLGLEGGLLANAAPSGLLHADLWRLGLDSTRGSAALTALASALLLTFALRTSPKIFAPMTILGLLLCLASFALSGHVATAQPRWLTLPVLLLHVVIAGGWMGSFLPLLRRLDRRDGKALPTITSFSRAMTVALPVLLLCGLVIAAVQLQALAPLTESGYGQILLLKLLLVGALIALAANNKLRLTPRLRRSPDDVAALRRSVHGEIALGLAILAATAFLSQTIPPRSQSEHAGHDHVGAQAAYSTVTSSHGRLAFIDVDPAIAGRNSLDLRFADGEGRSFSPLEVNVELANPSAGIEAMERGMEKVEEGHYRLVGPELAVPGTWTIRVKALINDFEQADFDAEIPVRR